MLVVTVAVAVPVFVVVVGVSLYCPVGADVGCEREAQRPSLVRADDGWVRERVVSETDTVSPPPLPVTVSASAGQAFINAGRLFHAGSTVGGRRRLPMIGTPIEEVAAYPPNRGEEEET
jgi:hypothetical protein